MEEHSTRPITTPYRKPTHTDHCLHFNSYHHPRSVHTGVIRTRVRRSQVVSYVPSPIVKKCVISHQCFGYRRKFVVSLSFTTIKATNKATTSVHGVSEKIQRICIRAGIRVCFKFGRTLCSMLTSVSPRRSPNGMKGCLHCNRSYIGETGRTLDIRLSEHRRCRNG